MGQRHQVYVAFKNYGKSEENPRTEIVGIHHQWLYGRTAAMQAVRMMRLVSGKENKSAIWDSYNPFHNYKRALQTLIAIYSIIPETGYFTDLSGYAELSGGECLDPRRGDNNNGISIFDFTDLEHPAYCFFAFEYMECCRNKEHELFTPMSVAYWLDSCYYPRSKKSGWQTYQRENNKSAEKEIQETLAECDKIKADAKGLKLLTPKRLKELFPAMFASKQPVSLEVLTGAAV
jgi:hypothetical protein